MTLRRGSVAKQRAAGRKRPAGAGDSNSRGEQPRQSAPPAQVPAGKRGLFNTRGLAARPRMAALIIAVIGFVLTEVNRETVRNERHFYPVLLLFGPVCALYGIGGVIDPRVLNPGAIE